MIEVSTYLWTLGGLVALFALGIFIAAISPKDSTREAIGAGATTAGFLGFIVFLFLGSVVPLGPQIEESKPAKVIRVENTLVVSVEGWPVQTVTDMKFLDQPLKIVQTTTHNGWGSNFGNVYTVEINKNN